MKSKPSNWKMRLLYTLTLVLSFAACKKTDPPVSSSPPPPTLVADRITDISLSSTGVKTPKLGFMSNYLNKPSWRNQSFIDSVRKLGLEIIRYPGGTESQYFDWQTGRSIPATSWGPSGLQNHGFIGTVPHVSYPLSELKYFYDQTGVKPIFCLNLLTKNLSDQLQMLQTAQSLGIPVEYIELGNELYFADADFVAKYPTPNDYVSDIKNNWIPTLTSSFPAARLAVIGSFDLNVDLNGNPVPARISTWNNAVLSQIATNHAITFHYYLPPNTTTLSNPVVPQALAASFKHWTTLKQATLAIVPAGRDVYITEYNLNDGNQTQYAIASTWTHGLYTSALFLQMIEEPSIKMLLNHQITGSASFASLTSFTPYGDTIHNRLSAEGNAMRLLHQTLIGSDSCFKFQFSNNLTIQASGVSYPGLMGLCVKKQGRTHGLLLNLSDQSVQVNLSSLALSTFLYEQISTSNPLQKNIDTRQLSIVRGSVTSSIVIPRYSLTSLTP
jgi:hypothetical protein